MGGEASLQTCGISYSLRVTEVPGKPPRHLFSSRLSPQHLVLGHLDSPGTPSTPSPDSQAPPTLSVSHSAQCPESTVAFILLLNKGTAKMLQPVQMIGRTQLLIRNIEINEQVEAKLSSSTVGQGSQLYL